MARTMLADDLARVYRNDARLDLSACSDTQGVCCMHADELRDVLMLVIAVRRLQRL